MSTHINFTHVNEIEAMNRRSRVNVKVEPRSTFAFTRGLLYIASISRKNYATVEIHLNFGLSQNEARKVRDCRKTPLRLLTQQLEKII